MNLQEDAKDAKNFAVSFVSNAFSWTVARAVAHPKITLAIAFLLLILAVCRF